MYNLNNRLRDNNIKAKAVTGGSIAKKTFLKGDLPGTKIYLRKVFFRKVIFELRITDFDCKNLSKGYFFESGFLETKIFIQEVILSKVIFEDNIF